MKNKLFTKFQELNELQDGNTLNFLAEDNYKGDHAQMLSIEDIINLDSTISERFVFKFYRSENQQAKYLQMKVKEYFSNDKKIKQLQIVDVTHHILYKEYKAKHQFTDIINACVSHELRNPLNSIMATNIEK